MYLVCNLIRYIRIFLFQMFGSLPIISIRFPKLYIESSVTLAEILHFSVLVLKCLTKDNTRRHACQISKTFALLVAGEGSLMSKIKRLYPGGGPLYKTFTWGEMVIEDWFSICRQVPTFPRDFLYTRFIHILKIKKKTRTQQGLKLHGKIPKLFGELEHKHIRSFCM